FGSLTSSRNRQRMIEAWLASKLFRATGLEAETIKDKLSLHAGTAGDFLRIVMDEIARSQGAQRWAENSPEGMLFLPAIKQAIPNALVIHIIRDGRDVAMSLGKVRYIRPFPWQELQSKVAAGVYWDWIVKQGRAYGTQLGRDYLEVRFEELVTSPQ